MFSAIPYCIYDSLFNTSSEVNETSFMLEADWNVQLTMRFYRSFNNWFLFLFFF